MPSTFEWMFSLGCAWRALRAICTRTGNTFGRFFANISPTKFFQKKTFWYSYLLAKGGHFKKKLKKFDENLIFFDFFSKSGIFEIFDFWGVISQDWKTILENALAQILLSISRLHRSVFSPFWNIEVYKVCSSLPHFLRQCFLKGSCHISTGTNWPAEIPNQAD